ncbi:MAG: hypothetical protein LLF94_04455 [Chlamydiales bacterium]|nr:hypothetical protein [Chlamydiales bacterium]
MTFLVGPVVGILGNLLGRLGSQEQTLERFLAILSSEFAHRVENIVRDAFTEQNLLEVRTDILSSVTAFRTFTRTENRDFTQFNLACEKVLTARSRVFTSCEQILNRDPRQYVSILDPEQKGRATLQHDSALKAAMAALQTVAALDLLLLSKKIERYPTLRAEGISRIDEYVELASRLKSQYEMHQHARSWVIFEHRFNVITFWALSNASRYVDGKEVKTFKDGKFLKKFEELEPFKEQFQYTVSAEHNADNTLSTAATEFLTRSNGNIEQAITLWTTLQTSYR